MIQGVDILVKFISKGKNIVKITFSTVGIGSIADGDVVTIDMIDGNGCVTDSSTQSRTVSVSTKPNANLSSSVTDGIFCAGDLINFNASGGVSYEWYINGDIQVGCLPYFSKSIDWMEILYE